MRVKFLSEQGTEFPQDSAVVKRIESFRQRIKQCLNRTLITGSHNFCLFPKLVRNTINCFCSTSRTITDERLGDGTRKRGVQHRKNVESADRIRRGKAVDRSADRVEYYRAPFRDRPRKKLHGREA